MTPVLPPVSWVALAGLLAVTALPSAAWVRAAGLGAAGRLVPVAGVRRTGGRRPGARAAHGLVLVGLSGTAAGWAAGGAPVAAGTGAVLLALAVLARDTARGRRSARERRRLLDAFRLLVADLEAGAGPAQALGAAGEVCPHRPEFRQAAVAAAAGRDAAAALAASGDPHVRALGLAWALGAASGAALADVLGRVAADLAEVDARRRAVAVAVAGPRASALMLSGLPALGLVLGAAMGAHPLSFLLAGPGRIVGGAGLLLDAAGLCWIRRILRRAGQ